MPVAINHALILGHDTPLSGTMLQWIIPSVLSLMCVALLVIMRINIEHMMYVLDCSCIDIYVSTAVPQ